MKVTRMLILCTLLFLSICTNALAIDLSAFESEDYLAYTLPDTNTPFDPAHVSDYIITWEPRNDVYEYHIGVFCIVDSENQGEYFSVSKGWIGLNEFFDGEGTAHIAKMSINDSMVIAGSSSEAKLDDLIAALGPARDAELSKTVSEYYCFITIVPESGRPINQLIAL